MFTFLLVLFDWLFEPPEETIEEQQAQRFKELLEQIEEVSARIERLEARYGYKLIAGDRERKLS